ncbi:MAG TPA: ferredoxin oxidoreductase [Firmicutes bacterium]|jgi:2-oxoglutarate ferredoxin oxidoreductase subunit alpha|nr:ferredoxin oxidoreductase [Bacillota bacterium]
MRCGDNAKSLISESEVGKIASEGLRQEYEEVLNKEKRMFMTGNEVIAWAALAANADFMYGYPITPQNEIMHYWAKLAPHFGRGFLQTEDEISAGFAMLGGALVGKKTFSGTAGPGNILMQEPIAMAEMMRLPGVWVIQQRGGPSTATVIYSQQELRLTATGGNGEGMRIVYSTSSHQELFEYTIKAFNAAWKYRFPAFVLGDGYQAKMRETVTLFRPEARGWENLTAEPILLRPGIPYLDRDPVHLRNTFNIEEELNKILMEYVTDFEQLKPALIEWEEESDPAVEVLIVAHGIVARAAKGAVENLKLQGWKVGYFRPITVRPFPGEALRRVVSENPELKIVVVESAYGQLLSIVKEELYGLSNTIASLLRPGVGITTEEIEATIVHLG